MRPERVVRRCASGLGSGGVILAVATAKPIRPSSHDRGSSQKSPIATAGLSQLLSGHGDTQEPGDSSLGVAFKPWLWYHAIHVP